MAVPDSRVTIKELETSLITVCQLVDLICDTGAIDYALDRMDLDDEAFQEEMDVIRAFVGYDPDDVIEDEDEDADDEDED